MIITIDGPAVSGKSTIAQELSRELGMYYLYTGLLYRAVGYLLAQKYGEEFFKKNSFGPFKIDPKNLDFIQDLSYQYRDDKPVVLFKDKDVTSHLLKPEIDQLASIVSANKHVRDALLPLQRKIGQEYDIIADGRDCGSVVFPNADYKFYLTASLEIRAQRLLDSVHRKGHQGDLEQIKQELDIRDKRDSGRQVAPLKKPDNAIFIDNSDMSLEQTIKEFLRHIQH